MIKETTIQPNEDKINADVEAADKMPNESLTGPDDIIETASDETDRDDDSTQKQIDSAG